MKNTIKSAQQIARLFSSGERFATKSALALFAPIGQATQEQPQPAKAVERAVGNSVVFAETAAWPAKDRSLLTRAAGRVAFVAGKKLGNAPQRNRAKRRLRAAAAGQGAPWPGYDVVLVARQAAITGDFAALEADLGRLANKLARLSAGGRKQSSQKQQVSTKPPQPRQTNPYFEEKAGRVSPADTLQPRQANPAKQTAASDPSRQHGLADSATHRCQPAISASEPPARVSGKLTTPPPAQLLRISPKKRIRDFIVHLPRNFALTCITMYRHVISPLFSPTCRFLPTCSEYALIAFERFGFIKGLWLTIKRVGRCHPLSAGGWDPVPERVNNNAGKPASEEVWQDRDAAAVGIRLRK